MCALGRGKASWGCFFGAAMLLLAGGGCVPLDDMSVDGLNPASRYFETALKYRTGSQPFSIAGADFNGDGHADIVTVNQGTGDLSLLLSNGAGSFHEPEVLMAGAAPAVVKALDVNGNGRRDLLVSNFASDDLSFLAGNTDGSFQPAESIPLPPGARALDMVLADFNGDGTPDLVTADSGLGSISILPGLGAGEFGNPFRMLAGDEPRALAVADITGNGHLDILCANRLSGDLALYEGLGGDEGFANAVFQNVGDRPFRIHVADIDGDGLPDVLVVNAGSKEINVLFGNGQGGLASGLQIPTQSTPLDAVFGDFNGDGVLDVAVLLLLDGNEPLALGMVEVFYGDGDGGFGEGVVYGGGTQSLAMTAADMNGNGRLDLLMADTALDRVSVVLGKSGGGFESDRRFKAGEFPRAMKLVDLTGDNNLDLVVANFQSRDVMVYHGGGDGTFTRVQTIPATDFPRALALGDLNGDGNLDLVVTLVTLDRVAVFPGNASGTFNSGTTYSVRQGTGLGREPRSVALGDLNGDGHLDVVTGNVKTDTISVLLGDGTGALSPAVEFFMGNFPLDVHLADLNGNGHLDVVATNGIDSQIDNLAQPRVSAMLGLGDGTFDLESRTQFSTGGNPTALVMGDLTLSGALDVVTLHPGNNSIYVLEGRGNGQFVPGQRKSAGDTPIALALGDVNRNGRLDVITANGDESISIMLNRGSLVFDFPVRFFAGTNPLAIAVGDVNGDGFVDVVIANQGSNDIGVMLGRPSN